MNADPYILVVGGNADELRSLAWVCRESPWTLHAVRTVEQAQDYLRSHPTALVLCQYEDRLWTRVFDVAASLPHPPNIIVFSRRADDRLWAEVLNLGGFDVLPLPAGREEFRRTIDYALRSWQDHSQLTAASHS